MSLQIKSEAFLELMFHTGLNKSYLFRFHYHLSCIMIRMSPLMVFRPQVGQRDIAFLNMQKLFIADVYNVNLYDYTTTIKTNYQLEIILRHKGNLRAIQQRKNSKEQSQNLQRNDAGFKVQEPMDKIRKVMCYMWCCVFCFHPCSSHWSNLTDCSAIQKYQLI